MCIESHITKSVHVTTIPFFVICPSSLLSRVRLGLDPVYPPHQLVTVC